MAKDMCWKVVSQRLTTYHGGSLHWKILIGLRRKEVLAGGWPGGMPRLLRLKALGGELEANLKRYSCNEGLLTTTGDHVLSP